MLVNQEMATVAVVGAGQIGGRHLQARALSRQVDRIEVVGRSTGSTTLAMQRYGDVAAPGRQSILPMQAIADLSDAIDVAIVATNADVRFSVVSELIGRKRVRFLILEKVAFQSALEFESVLEQLLSREIGAWVNCFRRTLPAYADLKKSIARESAISFTVDGGNWGLGCNAVHYLDLCGYLTGERTFHLDPRSALDDRILASKRHGFVEFTGRILGRCGAAHSFELRSRPDSSRATTIHIEGRGLCADIDELNGTLSVVAPDAPQEARTCKLGIPLQSAMTNLVVEEILRFGRSKLPSLAESYAAHAPLLRIFSNHLEKLTGEQRINCPIT